MTNQENDNIAPSYMVTYYQKNKEKMLKAMLKKEQCPKCLRQINHCFMQKHQKTAICARNCNQYSDIEKVQKKLEALQSELESLKNL